MIPELRDLSYKNRLLQCGLTTLETRRLRRDQIEVFKIVNGYEDVDRNMFFKLKESQWLPCPLAIWNLLFGMAILLNLVKSC